MKSLQCKTTMFCIINVGWNSMGPALNFAIPTLVYISDFIALALPCLEFSSKYVDEKNPH